MRSTPDQMAINRMHVQYSSVEILQLEPNNIEMGKKVNSKSFAKILLVAALVLNILLIVSHYVSCWMYQKSVLIEIFMKPTNVNNTNRMFEISDFKYLISKSECARNGSFPYFVTLIHSSPTQFERRAAIRDTWMSTKDPRTVSYFLLGTVKSDSLQKRLDQEEFRYHDIIQGNFIDSYHNLTYKHTMALKWFSENCPNVKYLLKMDDDVFVNVPAVHEYLANNTRETKFILGVYYSPIWAARSGKWGLSFDELREKYLPEYSSGQTVIYSSDFVKEAYKRTATTRFLWVDDLLISGFIRMQMNVRVNDLLSLRLSDDALQMVLNGTNTTLPDPMFLVSEHDRKYEDMIKLWNLTEPYRREHKYRTRFAGLPKKTKIEFP